MDVVVPVDKIRRPAQGALESIELPVHLIGHLGPVDPPRERLADQLTQPGQPAAGRQTRHRPQGRLVGEHEVQTGLDTGVKSGQAGAFLGPEGAGRHAAGGADATGVRQPADGFADARRDAVVVGAEDDAVRGPGRHRTGDPSIPGSVDSMAPKARAGSR